jgi:hypothetical protein
VSLNEVLEYTVQTLLCMAIPMLAYWLFTDSDGAEE